MTFREWHRIHWGYILIAGPAVAVFLGMFLFVFTGVLTMGELCGGVIGLNLTWLAFSYFYADD